MPIIESCSIGEKVYRVLSDIVTGPITLEDLANGLEKECSKMDWSVEFLFSTSKVEAGSQLKGAYRSWVFLEVRDEDGIIYDVLKIEVVTTGDDQDLADGLVAHIEGVLGIYDGPVNLADRPFSPDDLSKLS